MFLSNLFGIIQSHTGGYKREIFVVRCINDEADLNLDGNTRQLKAGNLYTLVDIDAHAFYTWYYLKEFPGMKFNSVRFEHFTIK